MGGNLTAVTSGRLVRAVLAAILLVVQTVGPVAAQGVGIRADDQTGNGIVSAEVKDQYATGRAIVTVHNLRRFWVAIEPADHWGSMIFEPAPTTGEHGNLGGAWATIAVIPPRGTAAYDLSVDPRVGGSQAFRVHFDGTSVGGLAAVALNVVQLVSHALGGGELKGGSAAVATALRTLTQLPGWADIVRKNQGDAMALTDLPGVITALLKSKAGRKALRQALGAVGIDVGLPTLRKIATGVSAAEVLSFLEDLGDAVGKGHVDGSVAFYALGPTGEPTPARTSGLIACQEGNRMGVIDANGGEMKVLWQGLGRTGIPDWSPAGDRLAFVADIDAAESAVHVVDLEGNDSVLSQTWQYHQWLDGSRLVLWDKKGVRIKDVDTGDVLHLEGPRGKEVGDVRVSEAGDQVAVEWRMHTDQGFVPSVSIYGDPDWTRRDLGIEARPAGWSPDGSLLLVTRGADALLVNVADASYRTLGMSETASPFSRYPPAWSGDGQRVILVLWNGGQTPGLIVSVRATADGARLDVPGSDVVILAHAPGSLDVAHRSGRLALTVQDLAGGERPHIITIGSDGITADDWGDLTEGWINAGWTWDESSLLLLRLPGDHALLDLSTGTMRPVGTEDGSFCAWWQPPRPEGARK